MDRTKERNQYADSRLDKIEKKIEQISSEMKIITETNSFLEQERITRQDRIWACEKCGSRLGIYDSEKDELRVRYRDFFAWWKPGIDGYLKIVCRGCSHINEVRYTDNDNNI